MISKANMHRFIVFITYLLISFLLVMCNAKKKDNIPLIPFPNQFEPKTGEFKFSKNTSIISDFTKLNEYFASEIERFSGVQINIEQSDFKNRIQFVLDTTIINPEGYTIEVESELIKISSSTEKGIFLGMQTIFQMISPNIKSAKSGNSFTIPCSIIKDEPAFSWRGLNLDCARHFMEKDFIKRYIDILAYYKFNTFHWHLTEDQGWRIEIKKYPKLTEIGAWRKETDDSTYGGFYTQEDIKEIVEYAESRFINIVPEIEMPGHSLASLASYPENSCTGGPFEVTNIWGVHKDIYCAGREETFTFLQNILDEVIELFPGKYIHIGGDEAPKDRWKECSKCQARIKSEGLKDEHELQSYFIKRIVNYLHSKGKEVIGWEEILEGGLAPGVIVQSWLGYDGAVEAAKLGHYAIYSPTSHTYFDYDPDNFNLELVYSFNPIPQELAKDERKFILGSEANMWSERAPQETIDSKLFPRMLALSEVLWKDPHNSEYGANYNEFYSRVQNHYADLTARGIKFGRESKIFEPKSSYDKTKREFTIEVIQGLKDLVIRYTTDGTEPNSNSNEYKKPIIVQNTSIIKIGAFRDNQKIGKISQLPFKFHKGLNATISLTKRYHEKYKASGQNALIDGIRGTDDFRDGNWQGYEGVDFEAIIDLGSEQTISKVESSFFFDSNSYIFLPENVVISLSLDGENYFDERKIINEIPQKNSEILIKNFTGKYDAKQAHYIKLKAESIKVCPDWHPGANAPSWLFVDEIVIE